MQDMKFAQVLRYAYSGAVTIAVALGSHPFAMERLPVVDDIGGAAVIGGGTLFLGIFVYVVHRALIYPSLYKAQVRCQNRRRRQTLTTQKLDKFRWEHRKTSVALRNLGEWGDQVHLLYCSSWAVFIGLWGSGLFVPARFIGCRWSRANELEFALLGLGLLLLAWVHHSRYLRREFRAHVAHYARPTERHLGRDGC